MMEEAARRGHELFGAAPGAHAVRRRRGTRDWRHRSRSPATVNWYALGETTRLHSPRTTRCSCARIRRSTWSTSTAHICWSWRRRRARVVNRPRALRDNNEKFSITRFASVHRTDPGHAPGDRDSRIPRSCRRRHRAQAARWYGRCLGVPSTSRRTTTSGGHRDIDSLRTRTVMAQRYIAEIPKATSASS